ncbi:MAG: tetrathionate reductase family octaheme c-type cytochrome [Desulfobacteraceae bacterium]|nr:tetrathionate reductase family octaheme c-type cytochrome [Desulfobacteraceae bacterium]
MEKIKTSHGTQILGTLLILIFAIWIIPIAFADQQVSGTNKIPGMKPYKLTVQKDKHWTTTDHSKIKSLKQDFKSGDQITRACLSCHTDASMQFKKTIHWTWKTPSGKKGVTNGKAGHAINNFCISSNAMEDTGCLGCHVGWKGTEGEVNCLACHGKEKFDYEEAFEDLRAFKGDDDPDTLEIINEIQAEVKNAVQNITMPQRQNCGECHFKGGGGDGVKHGDLDTSLAKPGKNLDVHMAVQGANFSCTRCHTTVKHNIAGRLYTRPATMERTSLIEDDMATKITCESCHGNLPHKTNSKINDHLNKVACQTCHIPEFARVNPTKMWWDWARAGDLKNGKPYQIKGKFGKPTYKSIKGEFRWEKNVKPEYFWYNGTFSNKGIKDTIDPSTIVQVSHPIGDKNDPDSRIHPFKIHRGKQPYDKINKQLVAPLLSGPKGFWSSFDMNDAITRGNKTLDVPYSGEFDYIQTTYAFPITHMVAPKENALDCNQCHIRESSRLADLTGIYLPGRDKSNFIDSLGMIAVLGALVGVILHGFGRFFTRNGKED